MAILGLGTDIVETSRFREDRRSGRFLESVFTERERDYCLDKGSPEQHLAARFAAKEAAAKALMAVVPFVSVFQIEIVRAESGAPSIVLLPGRHGEPPPQLPSGARLHVSVSHSDHYAIATVILEQL